ncbi:hypothetical protein EV714DRAFT_281412 [Schizophyllum commune]
MNLSPFQPSNDPPIAYDCAVDPLLLTYPFDSTCKPTPTVWDEAPTPSSWADQDTPRNASTVTASPYPFDTLTRARDQLSTYAPTCPATWTSCPDVVLTDLPPSSTSPYLGLDTAFETISSPYVAPDDGGGLQANFRREVGSQAQTEASLKRRRALASSSSTYTCDRCPKTFTRKKNLQAGTQWAVCADNDGERDDLSDPSDSRSPRFSASSPFRNNNEAKGAIDEERALPGVYTLDQRMPVSHAPAHGIPSSTLRGRLRSASPRPGHRLALTSTVDALSGQYTPKSPNKSAGIDADSHKRLHEPVLPADGAPATVPVPGMLGGATETSPCSGGVSSARRCFPPYTNTFRKNVTTSNRQQASKKRRSLSSRSSFFCDLEGCSAAFTRQQNLKVSWLRATLQHSRAPQKPCSACAQRSNATEEDLNIQSSTVSPSLLRHF